MSGERLESRSQQSDSYQSGHGEVAGAGWGGGGAEGGGLQEAGIQQSWGGVKSTHLSAQAQIGAHYNKIILLGQ